MRGACGARLETLVGADSDGGAWPPALKLRESRRLFGQFSWVSISFADRDLVSQDLLLVLVPGMRLNCLARARREACGAFGAHQSLWAASRYSARRYAGGEACGAGSRYQRSASQLSMSERDTTPAAEWRTVPCASM